MYKPGSFVAKMSETNILQEYSSYLQQAVLSLESQNLKEFATSSEMILTYKQFKDYYISSLVGKDDFIDEMVRDFQFSVC